jgi:sulfotransferase family protein
MHKADGLPPVTDYHRTAIKILNGAGRRLQAMGLAKIDLDEEGLLQAAREATGLHDFGDESFRADMRLLLKLEEEGDLNPFGRVLSRLRFLRVLKNRLWAEDLFKRYPEILEQKIVAPIVIVGPPRSGTTRLHRMLAADDRFVHLKLWETWNPAPWPKSYRARSNGKVDPRITFAERNVKFQYWLNEAIAAAHPMGAMDPDEEIGLLGHSFCGTAAVVGWLKNVDEQYLNNSQILAYEYMVKLLKLISWWRGDDSNKPWILKCPLHMRDLGSLIQVFPDARLLFTHRDLIKVVGSTCSFAWNVAAIGVTDSLDPVKLGQRILGYIDILFRKTLEIRESTVPKRQQFDILYGDMNKDWQAVMCRAYDFIGMEFTDAAKQAMTAWLTKSREDKHSSHRYRLEDFGLEPGEVDRRLQHYRQLFAIPYEDRAPGG